MKLVGDRVAEYKGMIIRLRVTKMKKVHYTIDGSALVLVSVESAKKCIDVYRQAYRED